MKRTVIIPVLLSCLSIIIIGLNSCAGSQKEIIPSSEFAPYINAYTGGVISQSSPIRIELTQDQPVVDLNNELKENPFRFSPSLKGKAIERIQLLLPRAGEEFLIGDGTVGYNCYSSRLCFGKRRDSFQRQNRQRTGRKNPISQW